MDPSKTLLGLGIAASLYLCVRLASFIYLYTRPSSLPLYRYGSKTWALVTGASDGIGLGFAQELAQNGFNVVLHGRNPTKVANVRARLTAELPAVEFRIAVADASSTSPRQIDDLVASLQDLNLTVLINNVGGGERVQTLETNTAEDIDMAININARSPTQLTRAILPQFIKSEGRRLIMNIGSLADYGVPYAVAYGGSKAFNMAMSSSLTVEMKAEGRRNIEILAIPVGKVEVAHSDDPVTWFTPGARTMAKAALQRAGSGKPIVIAHFGHAVQKFFLDLLPASVWFAVVVPVMRRYKENEMKKR